MNPFSTSAAITHAAAKHFDLVGLGFRLDSLADYQQARRVNGDA
jgi:hypothetical protein